MHAAFMPLDITGQTAKLVTQKHSTCLGDGFKKSLQVISTHQLHPLACQRYIAGSSILKAKCSAASQAWES